VKGQAALEALLLTAALLAAIAVFAGALNSRDWASSARTKAAESAGTNCIAMEALAGHARAAAGFLIEEEDCLIEYRQGEFSIVEGAKEKR